VKILFLTLHTFSLTGGIEKVCSAISKVLSDLKQEQKIANFHALAMYDHLPNLKYVSGKDFKGYRGKRISFALSALKKGSNADIIILSHINLLIFGWLIKKTTNKRIILLSHGIEVWENLQNWKLKFLQKHCEIWAVSTFTAEQLLKQAIPKSNIKVLNNCLDPFFKAPTLFDKPKNLLKHYQLTTDQPVLFTLTRMSHQEQYKGYDQVIASMVGLIKKYPNIRYILAGKADELEASRIKKLINKYDLQKHISLTGFLPDDEINDHYLLADVFVMPSKGEGFGISFIEAAACGCMNVAGNIDGSVDALLQGALGKLVNPNDQAAIANAIDEVLSLPDRTKIAQTLQEQCLKHFSFERYKMKLYDLLATSPPALPINRKEANPTPTISLKGGIYLH
jgi:phosphatidylinositol alpha-1,6-mannosyltransferase